MGKWTEFEFQTTHIDVDIEAHGKLAIPTFKMGMSQPSGFTVTTCGIEYVPWK